MPCVLMYHHLGSGVSWPSDLLSVDDAFILSVEG